MSSVIMSMLGGGPAAVGAADTAAASSDNPLLSAFNTSRANNNTGPGVLKQLMGSLTGNPTDVGSTDSFSAAPGTNAADTNPTPSASQKQANLAPADGTDPGIVPLPQARPATASPYAQPTAIDPAGIEQLRQSLLTDAGQRDPNNPNGLAGRMASPNSKLDMQSQGDEAQSIDNSFRSPTPTGAPQKAQQPQTPNSARKSDAFPTGQTEPGNIDLSTRPVVHNSNGSISTVRSITVTDSDGHAVLIPTVVGDKVVSNKDAIAHYQKTGQHLGKFNSEAAADQYAESLHNDQAEMYKGR